MGQATKKTIKNTKIPFTAIAVIIGVICSTAVLWFVFSASEDVVYSDYIRLVNAYYPDVLNLNKILVPDILTRTPITFLFRFINLKLCHLSVNFDRVISVICIFGAYLVLVRYCGERKLTIGSLLMLLPVYFSLSKREMLLNGTGYIHFMTYIPFYVQFFLMDKLYCKEATRKQIQWMEILPWLTILLISGPYCAVFTVAELIGFLLIFRKNESIGKKDRITLALCALLPFLLYLLSNHFAVEDNAGASNIGLFPLLIQIPSFLPRFLLNGFASLSLGGDLLEYITLYEVVSKEAVYILGGLIVLVYVAAVFLFYKEGLWKETLFPVLLILLGFGSHFIVFLGRYMFLRESYSWSSRYYLQYQSGAVGILFVASMLWNRKRQPNYRKQKDQFLTRHSRRFLAVGVAILLAGNVASSIYEVRQAPDYKFIFQYMRGVELNYRNEPDEVLDGSFEYRHGADKIRSAFEILEKNHLNVFSGKGEKRR